MVMVANFSDEQLIIPKATVLGVVEEITAELVDRINPRDSPISEPLSDKQKRKRTELLYRKLLHGKLDHLPVKERQLTEPTLLKYAHLFHDAQMNDSKGTSVIEHEIPLNDTRSIRKSQQSSLCTEGGNVDASEKHARKRRDQGKPIPLVSPCNIGPPKKPRLETKI
jgi:hypothetical protein